MADPDRATEAKTTVATDTAARTTTATGGTTATAPQAAGAEAKTATPVVAPVPAADVAKDIVKYVDANDAKNAIKTAGSDPKKALDALDTAAKTAAFYALVKAGKPYDTDGRRDLTKLYTGSGTFARKKEIFQARYSITITAEGSTNFSETELDTLYAQCDLLPPGHVEGLSSFTELRRGGWGTHGGSTVTMGAQDTAANYSQTFRHEIGHAVDDKIGGPVETLRTTTAGWKKYGSVDDFYTEVGGLTTVPEAHRDIVKDAFKHFTESAAGNQAAPGKFEDILKKKIEDKFAAKVEDGKKAWEEVNKLWGKSTVMDVAKASYKDGYAHWNYANFVVHGGRAYFCGHYYGKVMSMTEETYNDIKAWRNASAAFSDKEWFAEVYAEWYRTTPAGSGRTFPGFVETFMKDTVAKLGEPTAMAPSAGGGSNPKVAK